MNANLLLESVAVFIFKFLGFLTELIRYELSDMDCCFRNRFGGTMYDLVLFSAFLVR